MRRRVLVLLACGSVALTGCSGDGTSVDLERVDADAPVTTPDDAAVSGPAPNDPTIPTAVAIEVTVEATATCHGDTRSEGLFDQDVVVSVVGADGQTLQLVYEVQREDSDLGEFSTVATITDGVALVHVSLFEVGTELVLGEVFVGDESVIDVPSHSFVATDESDCSLRTAG